MIYDGKKTPGPEGWCLGLWLLLGSGAALGEPLVVATWGGAYEAAQRAALFEPFSAETGIPVETVPYDGGVKALQDAGGWTVVDMAIADADTACEADLLADFDPTILAPAPSGVPASEDFLPGALRPCGVMHLVYATVLAYDDRAFPGEKPRTVTDFFDVERFPGERALRRAPVGLFEWALLSYGVPRSQLYDLLSTERGLALAFRKLNRLRPELRWWESGDEPIQMLLDGEVAMASAYNGRIFAAQNAGAPLTVIWDGQLLDANVWAIPRGADRERAERFIRFVTRAPMMAALANHISYGPARHSAQWRIGRHVETGVPMAPYLPTAPHHLEQAVVQDHRWYTRSHGFRERRFEAWLEDAR